MTTGVPVLLAEQLASALRRMRDAPDAWPTEWSCEQLDVQLINPITAGLYRVAGTARVGADRARAWRLILKVIILPDLTGTPLEFGYAARPHDFNFWKREVLARRAGLPDRFSSPLRPVRCWGTEDIDETTAWLWLEELDPVPGRAGWSLPELADAAYDWGAFAAQGVAMREEVQRLPWAARGWLRGWVGMARALGAEHVLAHAGCWSHALVRDRLPASASAAFVGLMSAADGLLDRLDALPQTVAHHDTQWNNLFRQPESVGVRTVAIDWSFFGTAPIGEDLGHHIASNLFLGGVQPLEGEMHAHTATEAYLSGLRPFGWRGEDADVRFAAVAVGALRMLPFAVTYLADLCPEFGEVGRWPEEQAVRESLDVEAVMDTWCQSFEFLTTLAERACVL